MTLAETRTGAQDQILLKGMRFFGRHGCLAAERELGQWFVVDLTLTLDLSVSGQSDDLADTVNYAGLYADCKAVVEGPPVSLLEALALRLLPVCFAYRQVERARVRLMKPQAPVGGPLSYAAVELERGRGDL